MKQLTPSINKDTGPVKYHCHDSCNACGENNDVTVTDTMDGRMMECRTVCRDCGHTDYWAHGWFESGQEMESKCATYSFG